MSVASHDLFNMKLRTCIDTGVLISLFRSLMVMVDGELLHIGN